MSDMFWCVYTFDKRSTREEFEIIAIYSRKADAEQHIAGMPHDDALYLVKVPIQRTMEQITDELVQYRLASLGLKLTLTRVEAA